MPGVDFAGTITVGCIEGFADPLLGQLVHLALWGFGLEFKLLGFGLGVRAVGAWCFLLQQHAPVCYPVYISF